MDTKMKAADGATEYLVYKEVLREAQSPTPDSGNAQATATTKAIIKLMAARAIEKMHDKRIALADKLTSQAGENCFDRNRDAHARTKRAHGTNDAVENKFATADFVMRTFRGISIHNASGVVQQRAAHDFDRPVQVVSDRRKRKATPPTAEEEQTSIGFFWKLDERARNALLTVGRRLLPASLQTGRVEKSSHDEEKLSRREEAVQRQLDTAVDRYASALELFDQWLSQGVTTRAELDASLQGKSVTEQLKELRRQIEMRTVGCGWTQFETKWSFFSDEQQHTIDKLKHMLLDDILPYELAARRLKQLPTEAAPPQLSTRIVKALGTADADALRLEAASVFNVEKLLERATTARQNREAQGISDSVEAVQPLMPPAFDNMLVGKRLEICWPYKNVDGSTQKIWASGTVRRVADGLTDKRSPRARKILPAGALLWSWDADAEYDEVAGEKWIILLPEKWNKHVQYAWRYDPCELRAAGAPPMPPREPQIETRA